MKAAAGGSPFEASLNIQNPAGYVNLDKSEADGLAKFISQCRIDQKDLASTTKAYNTCIETHSVSPEFWQTPLFVFGGFAVTFGVGLLIGLASK